MTAEQLEQILIDSEGEVQVAEAVRSINTELEEKYAELERRIYDFRLDEPAKQENDYFDSI